MRGGEAVMKAMSIKQPWAELIVSGVKDVENRTWSTDYRGPILIHAGKRVDPAGSDLYVEETSRCLRSGSLGAIVGSAFLFGCTQKQRSPWHESRMWGFYLADQRRLLVTQYPGQLSLFDIDVRRTNPPIVLCPRCESNIQLPNEDLCGCCTWYVAEYSDRFSPEPSRERRAYVDYLSQKYRTAFEERT